MPHSCDTVSFLKIYHPHCERDPPPLQNTAGVLRCFTMSARAPKLRKSKTAPPSRSTTNSADASASSSQRLIEVSDTYHQPKRPYGSQDLYLPVQTLLHGPWGTQYTQSPDHCHATAVSRTRLEGPHDSSDNPFSSLLNDTDYISDTGLHITYAGSSSTDAQELRRHRAQRKKDRHWTTWRTKTIPSLLQLHLYILRQSDSLRYPLFKTPQSQPRCSCGSTQEISIACVFFDRERHPL